MSFKLPKAVLWDLDGTIMDTGQAHYLSWEEPLAKAGIGHTPESFARTFGSNNAGVLRILMGREPSAELVAKISNEKEAAYRRLIPTHTSLFPHVLNWLSYFQSQGVKQAIASSAPYENIRVSLDTFDLWHFFDEAVSGEFLPSKPAPAVFLKAAEALGVPAGDCLVFEDSEPGVLGGHRAGMAVICKLGTVKQAPDFVLAAFEAFPEDPASFLAGLKG